MPALWNFEPGHTGAEFAVRHMMVTIVRGSYKNIQGTLQFDPADPSASTVEVRMDAASFSTKEAERDEHLRSADFLDVKNHPHITFRSTSVEVTGFHQYKLNGNLTMRGVTRPVSLDVEYSGPVQTPFEDTRIDFLAKTRINREEFGVSWNSAMPGGGIVVGKDVFITLDVEAIRAT